MKTKIIRNIILASVAVLTLAGCGKAEAPVETVEETSEVVTPFLADMEKYDSIISELRGDQYYAFANICSDYDVLLVSDGAYDNLDGNMASIDATLYGFDEDGNVIELGTATSGGTAYPLALSDGYIVIANNSRVTVEYVSPEGSVIVKKELDISYDTDGNATYYYFDLDEDFDGQTEDESIYDEMYEIYNQAMVINFTPVDPDVVAAQANMLGTYSRTYTEEIEGEDVEITESVSLYVAGACEVNFQDTISGSWSDTQITLDDGSEYEYSIDGDILTLVRDGESVEFIKQ